MISSLPIRFLHTHPGLEQSLGLAPNHVIVDRKDYDEIMSRIYNKEFETDSCKLIIPESSATDLTFKEEIKAPLIFKGEYLKTIDKSWAKFLKKHLKRK